MRPEQRTTEADFTATVDPYGQFRVVRNARELAVQLPASSVKGASAGVVGTIVWPSTCAMSYPVPSLPLLGSERPPVAITSRSAESDPWLLRE